MRSSASPCYALPHPAPQTSQKKRDMPLHRPAAPSDFDAVFDLYMHERVVPYLGYDPMPRDDFRPIFQGLLDSGAFSVSYTHLRAHET